MPRPPRPAPPGGDPRPPRAPRLPRTRRALVSAAGACLALALVGCSKDSHPTAPLVSTPAAPGPMITVAGSPRVSFLLTAFVNRLVGEDTLSGYFYVAINDTIGRRAFVQDVSLNGVTMRTETTGTGAPFRYVLRPVELGPGYRTPEVLKFSVRDTSGLTPPFEVTVEPSTFDLPPDSTALSQRKDLVLHWNGAAEQVTFRLTDDFGKRVSATLALQNETGVSQLLVRAQDLAGLAPGHLDVGSALTNSDGLVVASNKTVSATVIVSEARSWQLVP